MRKVNLRNVDPAIDDPDASTWCMFPFFLSFFLSNFYLAHPTLNRHSPPEVVANFKRRVPPRLPKPRKRDVQDQQTNIPPPRSAIAMGPVPLTVPSKIGPIGRARGFSAPGSFTPLNQGGAPGWGTGNYARSALPPLMVPSDPQPHQNNMYSSPHSLHPITPSDDTPSSNFHHLSNYNSTQSQYQYNDQNSWSYHSNSSSHNGSLSSLLNPSAGNNGYSTRPTPTINTSYGSPFSSMPMQPGEHSASSLSPDSRPTTGYSMSSVSSMYHDDYSRPGSSHHRPISPSRPTSSKSSYGNGPPSAGSLSVRRARRHSQAMSPYPSPYDQQQQQHHANPNEHHQQRPSTSPQPIDDHNHHHQQHHQSTPGGGSSGGGGGGGNNSIPRVRSMIQLSSAQQQADPYNGFSNSQAEFAYSAIPAHTSSLVDDGGHANTNGGAGWGGHRGGVVRPSTSTSSISAASHTSSSQANTPPVVADNYHGDTDINRCE